MLIDPYRYAVAQDDGPADPDFADVVLLLQARNGVLFERTGIPVVSVIGDGLVTATEQLFGEDTFDQPGTTSQFTDYVRARTTNDEYIFDGEFTIEGFFRCDVFNASFSGLLGSPQNLSFLTDAWIIAQHTSGVVFASFGGGGFNSGAFTLTAGTMNHYALTRSSANTVRLFINGVQRASGTSSAQLGFNDGTNNDFLIGSGWFFNDDNADLDGKWGEVRVTRKCRYTADFTPPSDSFPTH